MSASEATRSSISARSKCVRLSIVSRSDGSARATVRLLSCLIDRHHAVFPGDVPRDGRDDVIRDLQLAEVDHFRAEMSGLGLGDIGWAHHLVGHQQVHHPHAGGFGFAPRLGHLVGGHEAQVNQDV